MVYFQENKKRTLLRNRAFAPQGFPMSTDYIFILN
nr:MAG TPA: hypothetical protein [Caudoviricetes sp.]